MDPNEDYVLPEFTGEVYLTVTVTINSTEANNKGEVELEALDAIRSALRNMTETSVVIEDSDLYISNAPEDWLDKADRLYEQKHDK